MKIFSVKYLLLACMASSLFCTAGCFPFPHKAKGFTVQGEVRDNFNNDPVPDVRVEIELPGEIGAREVRTNHTGRFLVSSQGEWRFFYYLWPSDADQQVEIEAIFEHPRYESESVQDFYQINSDQDRDINFGWVYVNPRR
jgi:hypothetical protein